MALSSESNVQNRVSIQPSVAPEIIRALTPIFIAFIGGAIGLAVLMTGNEAGFGVASTALAGAAGLAQPGKEGNDERQRIEKPPGDQSS